MAANIAPIAVQTIAPILTELAREYLPQLIDMLIKEAPNWFGGESGKEKQEKKAAKELYTTVKEAQNSLIERKSWLEKKKHELKPWQIKDKHATAAEIEGLETFYWILEATKKILLERSQGIELTEKEIDFVENTFKYIQDGELSKLEIEKLEEALKVVAPT
jgi:hypothetical protein